MKPGFLPLDTDKYPPGQHYYTGAFVRIKGTLAARRLRALDTLGTCQGVSITGGDIRLRLHFDKSR